MEKQNKVLNKIHRKCGVTTPIGTKPNDECYTDMNDIIQELSYWAALDKFGGKRIICPCDWDIVGGEEIYSIEITYAEDKVVVVSNNLKTCKVVVDLWAEDNTVTKREIEEDKIDDFFRDKLTCNFVRTFVQNAREWGIKSITASGYNPATGRGYPFQEVDFSKYDICVTNPPFSLYSDFMKCVVDKIDFILLAPFLNRVNPNIGLPLMLRKAYLGYGRQIGLNFNNPTAENRYNKKLVMCDWITSFSERQDEINKIPFVTGIKYELYKDEYFEMENMTMKDGTHPMRLQNFKSMPDDYDGWMFCSVGILDVLPQDDYEWYGTNFHKYFNRNNISANPFNHKMSNEMCIHNNKQMFHGIVFRKKNKIF